MKKTFERFLDPYVDPLKSDPELQQEIRRELENHLEESAGELNGVHGLSGMELERELRKKFGEPEEISQSLLNANLGRLQFRAKIRLVLKCLLIPSVLLGAGLCLDTRSIGIALSAMKLNELVTLLPQRGEPSFRSPEDMAIFRRDPKALKPLSEKHPEDPLLRNAWIDSLHGNDPLLREALKRVRPLEPENSYYDYLYFGKFLLPEAVEVSRNGKIIIKSRQKLDDLMTQIRETLKKKEYRPRHLERASAQIRILNAPDDISGRIGQIAIAAGILLPELEGIRQTGRLFPFYAGILEREGKRSEAEFWRDAWKAYLNQMNPAASTLIEILVHQSILKMQRDDAETRNDPRRIKELNKAMTPVQRWKDGKGDPAFERNLRQHGGILTQMLMPALKGKAPTPEELEPERKLSYLFLDILTTGLQSMILCTLIVLELINLLFLYIRGQRGMLLLPSHRNAGKLFLYGILIPFTLYFLLTGIDVLSGRYFSIMSNLGRTILIELYFILLIPAWYTFLALQMLKRRGRELGYGKLSTATLRANLIFFWAFLLLFSGLLMRPYQTFEQAELIRKDTIHIFRYGFTSVEHSLVEKLRLEMENARKEIKHCRRTLDGIPAAKPDTSP